MDLELIIKCFHIFLIDFFCADESRSRVSGGSGLGLAICKNLVEAHGDQIEALEKRPRGLCIRLTLPLIQKEAT